MVWGHLLCREQAYERHPRTDAQRACCLTAWMHEQGSEAPHDSEETAEDRYAYEGGVRGGHLRILRARRRALHHLLRRRTAGSPAGIRTPKVPNFGYREAESFEKSGRTHGLNLPGRSARGRLLGHSKYARAARAVNR